MYDYNQRISVDTYQEWIRTTYMLNQREFLEENNIILKDIKKILKIIDNDLINDYSRLRNDHKILKRIFKEFMDEIVDFYMISHEYKELVGKTRGTNKFDTKFNKNSQK